MRYEENRGPQDLENVTLYVFFNRADRNVAAGDNRGGKGSAEKREYRRSKMKGCKGEYLKVHSLSLTPQREAER